MCPMYAQNLTNVTLGDGGESEEGTTPTEEEEPTTVWELPEAAGTQTTTTGKLLGYCVLP